METLCTSQSDVAGMGRCPFTQRAEAHSITCVDLHGVFSRRFNVLKYHRGIAPDPSSCCPWVVRDAARHPLSLPPHTPGGSRCTGSVPEPWLKNTPASKGQWGGRRRGSIRCGPTAICRLLPAVGLMDPEKLDTPVPVVRVLVRALSTFPFRPRSANTAHIHTHTHTHVGIFAPFPSLTFWCW